MGVAGGMSCGDHVRQLGLTFSVTQVCNSLFFEKKFDNFSQQMIWNVQTPRAARVRGLRRNEHLLRSFAIHGFGEKVALPIFAC